ncbi:hypothetical protein DPMN_070374 [Dreissena polymorpha]|uniref:Uncharacterized protein n=1 Tax=Dreissena polymorpha TaxID=45954 RepID=A0A9D3Z165_DREPO|nr:hypothetical protein DPMN_070374 [Dreissena polymorpha]
MSFQDTLPRIHHGYFGPFELSSKFPSASKPPLQHWQHRNETVMCSQRAWGKPKYPLETPLIPTTNQPHMLRERGLNPDRLDETRVYRTLADKSILKFMASFHV